MVRNCRFFFGSKLLILYLNRKKDGAGVSAHSIEIAAFQSKNSENGGAAAGGHDRIDVPLEIVPKTVPGKHVALNRPKNDQKRREIYLN